VIVAQAAYAAADFSACHTDSRDSEDEATQRRAARRTWLETRAPAMRSSE
jgi:hypothetical protein